MNDIHICLSKDELFDTALSTSYLWECHIAFLTPFVEILFHNTYASSEENLSIVQ